MTSNEEKRVNKVIAVGIKLPPSGLGPKKTKKLNMIVKAQST